MSRIVAATGRGGTGKTTFVAVASGLLDSPPLLIDADPDESLAAMLGIRLADQDVQTISEALFDLQKGKERKTLESMPLAERIEYLMHVSCLYEHRRFDLLSLGVKWTRGCYCHPNDVLRSVLPGLASSYRYTLVDSPGGLEHLNRRVMSSISDIFVVMDPSTKALRNVERVKAITEAIGVEYENLYLVGNHRFRREDLDRLRAVDGAVCLGLMEQDNEVERYDRDGRSLLELPADSLARRSISRILEKAGYGVRSD